MGRIIRIGFVLPNTGESWLGGLNYFKNLISSLAAFPEMGLSATVFTGTKNPESLFRGLPLDRLVRDSMLDRRHPKWILRKVVQRLTGRDSRLENLLKAHGVEVLSHASPLGKGARIPSLGWIPDFQHRHLPRFFSPQERSRRDAQFSGIAQGSARVILSSHDALKDFRQFYPESAAKGVVLQFMVMPPDHALLPIEELEKKYSFSGPYFFLPNQFWEHKNHRIVVEALRILKDQGKEVLVLCTGNTRDARNPAYFDSLMSEVRAHGLEKRFRTLGIVPYPDLAALMSHSVAVVNPSLFEGWSTTVEEAKSLGKRAVLSDIPVLREQAAPGTLFFAPDGAGQLADCLLEALAQFDRQADARARAEATAALGARRREFIAKYLEILTSVAFYEAN